MTIVWTTQAAADIRKIREYIARDAPGNAAAIVSRIRATVETLTEFPYLGRASRASNLRELIVLRTPYIVRHLVQPDVIRVLRVVHGAQRRPR